LKTINLQLMRQFRQPLSFVVKIFLRFENFTLGKIDEHSKLKFWHLDISVKFFRGEKIFERCVS